MWHVLAACVRNYFEAEILSVCSQENEGKWLNITMSANIQINRRTPTPLAVSPTTNKSLCHRFSAMLGSGYHKSRKKAICFLRWWQTHHKDDVSGTAGTHTQNTIHLNTELLSCSSTLGRMLTCLPSSADNQRMAGWCIYHVNILVIRTLHIWVYVFMCFLRGGEECKLSSIHIVVCRHQANKKKNLTAAFSVCIFFLWALDQKLLYWWRLKLFFLHRSYVFGSGS